jgi:hypothetical protein
MFVARDHLYPTSSVERHQDVWMSLLTELVG